jgi:hypothetical protein
MSLRWAEHVADLGETRNAYRMLLRKPLGREIRNWEDTIKIDVRVIICEAGRRMQMTRDRVQRRTLMLAVLET